MLRSSRVVHVIFYILGIGLLVPWNAFVSAKPYFEVRLCQNVEVWFGIIYNGSSVLSLSSLLALSWFRDDHPDDNKPRASSSTYWMVMGPLKIYLSVFLLTALMVFWESLSREAFFIITLASLAICGSTVSMASAGMVATASVLDEVGELFAGQAVGGVVVSIANLVAAWASGDDDYWERECSDDEGFGNDVKFIESDSSSCSPYNHVDWAVVVYFALGCLLLCACLVGYHYIHKKAHDSVAYEAVRDVENHSPSPRFVAEFSESSQSLRSGAQGHNLTHHVLDKIWAPTLALWLNFVVTLCLFPAWTSSMKSTHECISRNRFYNDLYTPWTFVVFNVFDLLGRLVTEGYSHYWDANAHLVPFSLGRVVFLVLFALVPTSHSITRVTPIPSDMFSLTILAAFGFSNGIVISWSFLTAPRILHQSDEEEQVRSSEILNLSLAIGLLSGSCSSWVYGKVMVMDP
jgi:equilibrative nucleoside transporter 1/2/3